MREEGKTRKLKREEAIEELTPDALSLVAGVILITVLAVIANRLHALDFTGALSGAVISFLVLLAGGFSWLIIVIVFVVISSVMTVYHYDYKRKLGFAQEKGGMRSWPNSVANGGVAAIAALAEIFVKSNLFGLLFLTSIVAAMSDTLATEVGMLSHSKPRLITNLTKFVQAGTSGGVTALGETVAFLTTLGMTALGTLLIVVSEPNYVMAGYAAISVIIGAMIGVSFDSVLGATVQAMYKCAVCGQLTENSRHHGQPSLLQKGHRFIDNNSVNFIAILVGAVASVGIYLLLTNVL